MVRHTLLRGMLSAFDSTEPAYRAETIDEYRELAMLAQAWELGTVKPGVPEGTPAIPNEDLLP